MKTIHHTTLALALAAAFPAWAQSNADVLRELQALKAQVAELEAKLKAQEAAKPQWGMTPDQARELNRITVKTEALEDSRDASGFKGLKISGYADPTYIYNRAKRNSGFSFLDSRGETGYSYDNSYFGSVVLDLQKETDSGTRWRLTLSPNRGTDSVIGNGSLVQEASVSVPLGSLQTRFIAGHLPDWSGYEYQQATLNKLVTHNLLYDFTLPTSYTGAGLEVTSGKWIAKGVLANMNAARNPDGVRAPVMAYRVDYSRGEFQGFGFAGLHGMAANPRARDAEGTLMQNPLTGVDYEGRTRVDLFEVDAYFIRGDWTVQGQFSVGQQKGASVRVDPVSQDLRDGKWTGLSALAAYKFNPRLEGVVRVDHIRNAKNGGGLLTYSANDDRNGIGIDPTVDCVADPAVKACNTGANRTALSLGLSYLWDLNTTFKVEYRIDRADLPVFGYADGTYRKSNTLLGASVVMSF
ncbi:MAG: DUF3138 family protein [Betaproteobacteria bacterium]